MSARLAGIVPARVRRSAVGMAVASALLVTLGLSPTAAEAVAADENALPSLEERRAAGEEVAPDVDFSDPIAVRTTPRKGATDPADVPGEELGTAEVVAPDWPEADEAVAMPDAAADLGVVTVDVVEEGDADGVAVRTLAQDDSEDLGVEGVVFELSPVQEVPAEGAVAESPEAAPSADATAPEPTPSDEAPSPAVPTEEPTEEPTATVAPEAATAPVPSPTGETQELVVEQAAFVTAVDEPAPDVVPADEDVAVPAVDLTLDYSSFAQAYGGDWASRLRVVELPACALTHGVLARCRVQTPVDSVNDPVARTVTASLAASSTGVVALAAAPGGSSGSWGATSLSPSSSWDVSEQTGDFSWSYPMRVPPSLGGPSPELSLSYSSGSLDGRVASTNNQTSWVGDGWDLSTGFIERRYVACVDDEKNGNNVDKPTGDQCWKSDNATMAFAGHSGELVKDASSGQWRLKNDDGTRIERKTGGWNGDDDGEYWVVTTTDGIKYYFGRGKRSADDTLELNSAWTVPVYGNQAGEPCYKADYDSAWCQQAWRWNLEYVVDPSGNSMTYVYAKETNKYGRNLDDAVSTYDRGGYLARIEYGQRAGSEADSVAPARVVFGVAERCLPKDGVSCEPDTLTKDTAKSWPDVPFDQICTSGTTCASQISPSFFTRKRLTTVTTQVRSGSAWQDVDRWSLTHTYPDPGDSTSPALWLSKIGHEGRVGDAITLPDVTFEGVQMANRVDTTGDAGPAMNRYRISSITAESGSTTSISYTPQDCTTGSLPASADSNTRRCFPVRWQPEGSGKEVVEYFHKYLVDTIAENPNDLISPAIETAYAYQGTPAWAYDDNPLVPEKQRTWGQWRGYATVDIYTGAKTLASRSWDRKRFFRGMNGDHLADGSKRSVSVDGIADDARLNGFVREEITYNGVGGAEVEGVVNTPWVSPPTATSSDGVKATFMSTRTVESRTIGSQLPGGKRVTRTVTTYDDTYGLPVSVDDQGDVATAADDRCTRTEYARNTAAHIVGAMRRTETVGVSCSATPARPGDVLADMRVSYDGQAYGEVPTRGQVTRSETLKSYSGTTPVYVTESTSTYDAYGRPTSSTDALGRKGTTAYTPATGGPLRSVTTTAPDPDGSGPLTAASSTTEVNAAWGAPTKVTDPNGKVASATYDALGRTTAVWMPGRTQGKDTADQTFAYKLARNGANSVTTKTLTASGAYLTSVAIYDGLLRPRQTQSPSASTENPGRLITDTIYDSRGLVEWENGAWFTTGDPAGTVVFPSVAVPTRTRYAYDGAGRVTAQISDVDEKEDVRTTTSYDGDRVSVDPPTGGVPSMSITDAAGQVVELRQFTGLAPTGTFRSTKYAYDRSGNLTSHTDPAGNVWSYTYDLRGRQVTAKDPDKGTTTSTYDDAGQLVSTKDARGVTLAYVRDTLGRVTELREGSATGTLRSSWTYDTLAKGQLTSSTRHVGTNAYTTAVTAYDDAYQPLGQSVTLPASEGALAGTYTTGYTYTADGQLATMKLPAVGSLPAETVTTEYNALSQAISLSGGDGWGTYVAKAVYDTTGELLQQDLGNFKSYSQNFAYEKGTRQLARTWLVRQGASGRDFDKTYTYDDAGNPTKIVDSPTGQAVDAQCFAYDGLRRLKEVWTPANADCSVAASAAGLGGPAPYWKAYAFDVAGNRTKEVIRSASSTTTNTYTYAASGATAVQPHAVTSITSVTGSTTKTGSYTYDANGATATRTPAGGTAQTLTWDAEQRLTTVKQGTSTVGSYVYTADGERLIRKQGGKTTVYLPGGQELTLTTSSGALAAQRYYAFAGQTVATRTGTAASTVSSLFADTQGTALVSVQNITDTVTVRRTDPYGNVRGTNPSWPGDHLFLDKVRDSTGLTQVGARYYDASIGRFVSVDPVLDLKDPAQWSAYSYGEHNPVTYSDPTGMLSWASSFKSGLSKIGSAVKNGVSSAWKSTGSFVKKHQASIVGFAAGAIVTGGCLVATGGVGSVGCAALGGAAAGAASNLWRTQVQKTSRFTVGGFVRETVFGAAMGAIGGAAAAAKPLASAAASWAGRVVGPAAQRFGAGALSAARQAASKASQALAQTAQNIRTQVVQQVRSVVQNASRLLPSRSSGAANAADDWVNVSGILRDAVRGKGNFGLGWGTAAEAQTAGRAWVGEGARLASDGKTLLSQDGLRQWRPPSFKPKWQGGSWQSNFESRWVPRGQWQTNGHLNISDMP
ncbi:RHS repeat-associated core domain-containing protein [Cellulomonas sp. SLBN-39]|uniref:RHS repeat-associated core domain-containing protein n=1 Tax=Cellulomonas sp. SLBN-39 TaxID=2768446 RepID=UPI00114F2959|nr:RHS repeat-associated core domain-containing protein [Cellulomonas sp. SLBN-39]TQL02728.1 RHS repeat-associated protein [Cellulomonas sp. SLBN-39]